MKTIVEVAQNLIKPFINSEDKKYAANIAPVETSPATAAHTAGTQLIYNGVLYNVTANIAADDPLATTGAGANIALADKVTEQISSQKQALSDEVSARIETGAHNLFNLDLARVKNFSDGTWDGNTLTPTDQPNLRITFNDDKTITVTGSTSSSNVVITLEQFKKSNTTALSVPLAFYEKEVILSGCPNGGSSSTYRLKFQNYNSSNESKFDEGNGVEFVAGPFSSSSASYLYLNIYANQTNLNVTFKPMITFASDTSKEFAPYAMTNKLLTDVVTGSEAISELSASVTTSLGGSISLYKKGQIVIAIYDFGGTSPSDYGEVIGSIPEGFRPSHPHYASVLGRTNGTWANADFHSASLRFLYDGTIEILSKISEQNLYFSGSTTWFWH